MTGRRYQRDELVAAWSHLTPEQSAGPAPPLPEQITAGSRTKSVESLAGTMRRRNIVIDAAIDAALTHNRLVCDPPLPEAKVRETVAGIFSRYPPPPETNGTSSSNGAANGRVTLRTGTLRPLSEVEPQAMRFVWEPALIRGALNLIAGDPGVGKGLVASAIAAGVSAGVELPGRRPIQGNVVWVSYEEAMATAIRPRLDIAGADVRRVYRLVIKRENGREERRFLPSDIDILEAELRRLSGVTLMVLDPVMSFMGGNVNVNLSNEVRSVLEPLIDLADAFDIALLALAHINKSELSKMLYRVSASTAFVELPRSVIGAGRLPDGRRCLGHIKSSYTEEFTPMPFDVVGVSHPTTGQSVGRIIWDAPDPEVDKTSLFQDHRASRKGGPAKASQCAERLKDLLADGPMWVGVVKQMLSDQGFGKDTVADAADMVMVETIGRGRSARWTLPGGPLTHLTPTLHSESTPCEVDLTESGHRMEGEGPLPIGGPEEEGDA